MQKLAPVAIEREAPNQRTLRRLSLSQTPGSLPLDPDLPIPRVPNGHYDTASPGDGNDAVEEDGSSDSSHVFWVPAHLHPELAPAEFRAFLAENTSSAPSGNPAQPIARSLSRGKSLGRQKSMLSKQYRPSANDGVETDPSQVPKTRNIHRTSSRSGPTLSAADLQTLEALADEAARSGDPSRLRSVLKRSISMNQTSVIDQMDDIGGDNADEPIAVPQPSQSLKRSARTKIRKSSLQGTGGGHRFAATRRGKVYAAAPDRYIPPYDTSTTLDSTPTTSDSHTIEPPRASFGEVEEQETGRPLSYSEEAAIYDSYADRASMDQDDPTVGYEHPSPPIQSPPTVYEPPAPQFDPRDIRPASAPPVIPASSPQPPLHHPAPRHHLPVPSPSPAPVPARSPSPSSVSDTHTDVSSIIQSSTSPASKRREQEKQKEKEKKGLWGKSKKKDKPKGSEREVPREKEKEGSFFGSLFGGKKKNDEATSIGSGQNHAAAAALLGQSRSKASATTPEPPGPMGYARYPIHVERAVYRLSHIKLANPRRPLHEQVLISNLMFWYLGVINKPTTPQPAPQPQNQQQPATPDHTATATAAATDREEKERLERERLESEQHAAIEREQQEQASRREPSMRKGLNKTSAGGSDPRTGARKAEMPIKGPQYGIGMVIEQGVGYEVQEQGPRHGGQPPPGYDAYGPSADQQYRQPRIQRSPPPQLETQPVYQEVNQYPSYGAPLEQVSPRNSAVSPPPITRQPPRSPPSSLPPGAMPPVSDPSHSWVAQTHQMNQQTPAGPRPPLQRGGGGSHQSQEYDQYYAQQPRARSVPPADQRQDQAPDVRQQRSPPPQQQPSSSIRNRTPSYTAANGQPSPSKPRTPPEDAPAGKIQGRSLSASAVPSQNREPRSRSPPDSRPRARSRSRTREEVPSTSPPPALPLNGSVRAVRQDDWRSAAREEEDLPLAVYQRQQQQQHHQHQHPQPHPQYYPQQVQQSQDYDRNYPRR